MRILTARFRIQKEAMADFEAARENILSALSKEQPKGVRYTWCKIPNSPAFVGWLELDDGADNPLPTMAAGREFQEKVGNWIVEPPVYEELEVVGSYGAVRKG